jgi:hypothetical protein
MTQRLRPRIVTLFIPLAFFALTAICLRVLTNLLLNSILIPLIMHKKINAEDESITQLPTDATKKNLPRPAQAKT